jgi:hypothetical protein
VHVFGEDDDGSDVTLSQSSHELLGIEPVPD